MITLYKNVDILDLTSIAQKGILSMDACKNNPWEPGERAANRTDVVYLFKPLHPEVKNSFINYGIVLLQLSLPEDSVKENAIGDFDVNRGKYTEYITDYVSVENIVNIYIPEIFKNRIEEYDKLEKILPSCHISWCDIQFSEWDRAFTPERLERFAKTAPLSTQQFNYFRGVDEKRRIIDIKKDNIVYVTEH
ncbi:MAG: hypothetical protein K6G10_01385 [Butyrivibrio sp.]|nr:hypothetical protein [Butyrivibrio sp.]